MNNFLAVQPTLWSKGAKPATLQNWEYFLASYRVLSTPCQMKLSLRACDQNTWLVHRMTTTPCAGMQSTKKRSRTASQNSSQRDIVITVIPSLGLKNSVSTKAWNSMVHVLHQSPFIRSASAPENFAFPFPFEWFPRHWHFESTKKSWHIFWMDFRYTRRLKPPLTTNLSTFSDRLQAGSSSNKI